MDTALITFMMQTSPCTQSVHLIGSWDNFSKHYAMERDSKRARGQWRGCYAFTDITCDGDGANGLKRTGGLKMGSTYYYYYELDNGTEVHDSTVPFTTTCPYLPGQPVNLLSVPTEIQTLRHRSASMSSMASQDIKTMNPADKFVAPRPPPPTPMMATQRATTSPSLPTLKARSVSPKRDKTSWSPKSFFGIRAPHSYHNSDSRGRSASSSKEEERANIRSMSAASTTTIQRVTPVLRDISPQPPRRSHHREISPPRSLPRENSSSAIIIPDEIVEEGEDDDNFASQSNLCSLHDRGIFTELSPPPSGLRSPPSRTPRVRSPVGSIRSAAPTTNSTTKPLPELPDESLVPQPLLLRSIASTAELSRSHFSISTTSSSLSSPFDAQSTFNDSISIADSIDDEELVADSDCGEELAWSPISASSNGLGFTGYSLPDDDYSSEGSLHKEAAYARLTNSASRVTLGGNHVLTTRASNDFGNVSALEELLSEAGYLGNVIVGK